MNYDRPEEENDASENNLHPDITKVRDYCCYRVKKCLHIINIVMPYENLKINFKL